MTPEDASYILEPIWQGFAASRCRIRALRDRAEGPSDRVKLARWVIDLESAENYLQAVLQRFLCSATGGLLTVIEAGRKVCAWPNVHPDPTDRQRAEVAWFARRFEAELSAVQPLRKAAGAE